MLKLVSQKINLFSGKLNLANPYATSVEDIIVKNTTGITSIRLFAKNLPNVYCPVPCHPFINESVTIF